MKQLLKKTIIGSLVALTVSPAYAGDWNVGIHLGPLPTASYYAPSVVTTAQPRMVYADRFGCYVAVGVPYDMYYLQNSYYLFQDGRWHRSRSSRGPWLTVNSCDLPRNLYNRRIEDFRDYRRNWEGRYLGGPDWGHGSRTIVADRSDHWRDGASDWQRPWHKQDREWNRR